MRRLLDRLTYANVMATFAVFLALTGTAYAAGLGRNTVGSPQIKNGAVTSTDVKDKTLTGADVKDGGLSGADLKDDSITDDQVDEDSLDTVPDAAELDGTPADEIPVVGGVEQGAVAANGSLHLDVSGYGDFYVGCDDGTQPTFSYSHDLGANATDGLRSFFGNGPYTTPGITLYNRDATDTYATLVGTGSHMQVDQTLVSSNGAKAVHVTAYGWDDPAGCFGVITATVLR